MGGDPVNAIVDDRSAQVTAALDSPAVGAVLVPAAAAPVGNPAANGSAVTVDHAIDAADLAGAADGVADVGDLVDLVDAVEPADTADIGAVSVAAIGAALASDDARANLGGAGEPPDMVARPTEVTETLAASALVPDGLSAALAPPATPAAVGWDADRVVTEIYHGEYKSLVRLAVLLVHDVPTAEEVVQDAFEAMHTAWRRLREKEKALSYLRQAVVNRSRSVLRHRTVVDRNAPKPAPDEPSAEHGALALIERSAVIAALRTLPDRQREAVVLRYYADLSEADIAATMGISRGAVKSHTARAMAALKSILELETS